MNNDFLDAIDPDSNYLSEIQNNTSNHFFSVSDFCETFTVESNMLNILNWNVRSFNSNSKIVLPLIDKSRPHVMVFSETWFFEDSKAEINSYDSHHTIRNDRRSGGVSLYVSNSLRSFKIDELSYINDDIEICSVEVVNSNESLTFIGIYRPHSGTIVNFNSEITRVLNCDRLKNKKICVLGDFNINLLQENISNNTFVETLQSFHFYNLISLPTRISSIEGHAVSLLDHIWLNCLDIVNSGVVSFDLLDHLPSFLQFPLSTSVSCDVNVKISFRLNNDMNRENFHRNIENFDWACLVSPNIHEYVANFIKKLDEMYCSAFPLKSKIVSKRKANNPWFDSNLGEFRLNKNLLILNCYVLV